MGSESNQEYPRASNAVVFGGLITYIGGVLLVISFTSPYWIQSYQETFSNFKHMGLWEYCFHDFRYPYYQFDKMFNGCHHIFSQEFHVIREWLLPPWLMVVQTFATISLLLSFVAQGILALVIVRWPLRCILRNEWLLSGIAFICDAATAFLLFLAVSIFGGQCWRRDWLMYPNWNYLSWSYAFGVIACMFHGLAAFFLYLDARAGYKNRAQSRNLVVQMQPTSHSRQSFSSSRQGYI